MSWQLLVKKRGGQNEQNNAAILRRAAVAVRLERIVLYRTVGPLNANVMNQRWISLSPGHCCLYTYLYGRTQILVEKHEVPSSQWRFYEGHGGHGPQNLGLPQIVPHFSYIRSIKIITWHILHKSCKLTTVKQFLTISLRVFATHGWLVDWSLTAPTFTLARSSPHFLVLWTPMLLLPSLPFSLSTPLTSSPPHPTSLSPFQRC